MSQIMIENYAGSIYKNKNQYFVIMKKIPKKSQRMNYKWNISKKTIK